jgi:hypothetical protein
MRFLKKFFSALIIPLISAFFIFLSCKTASKDETFNWNSLIAGATIVGIGVSAYYNRKTLETSRKALEIAGKEHQDRMDFERKTFLYSKRLEILNKIDEFAEVCNKRSFEIVKYYIKIKDDIEKDVLRGYNLHSGNHDDYQFNFTLLEEIANTLELLFKADYPELLLLLQEIQRGVERRMNVYSVFSNAFWKDYQKLKFEHKLESSEAITFLNNAEFFDKTRGIELAFLLEMEGATENVIGNFRGIMENFKQAVASKMQV